MDTIFATIAACAKLEEGIFGTNTQRDDIKRNMDTLLKRMCELHVDAKDTLRRSSPFGLAYSSVEYYRKKLNISDDNMGMAVMDLNDDLNYMEKGHFTAEDIGRYDKHLKDAEYHIKDTELLIAYVRREIKENIGG